MKPAVECDAAPAFDRAFAAASLRGQPWSACNRKLAEYWLTLWDGDALPARTRFSPGAVRELLPGIMIMEIAPNRRIAVRLAGTAINAAFGVDITGKDLLALSPSESRDGRLARNSLVAAGAASLCLRYAKSRLGETVASQEIQLPFRDFTADGARLVLFHTSWRPEHAEPGVPDVSRMLDAPTDWRLIPLKPE
jgi:PAS domain